MLWYSATLMLPLLLFFPLSGTLGGGESGFGLYSMNLLSPVWPQRSGLLGPRLPVLDATGGQYEGYNYLDAGLLVAIGVSGILLLRAAVARRSRSDLGPTRSLLATAAEGQHRALGFVLLGLTALAVSTRVYAGRVLLISLRTRPSDQIFGIVQSSGRAF
jgi:hypothetical protein